MRSTSARRLHVVERGAGEPVVLLHPLALSARLWDPLAAHLAAQFHVLAIDARGHGGSPWDGEPFSIADLADDVAALVRARGIEQVSVCGLSMGGSTALELAVRHSDLVAKLVVADATACYGDDREATWEQRARKAAENPRSEQVPFQVERWFSPGFAEANPDEVARVVDIFLATDSAAHAAACRALGGLDVTARLHEIEAPTLVVVGEDDYATTPAMAEVIASGVRRGRLARVPGARHLTLIERSELWPLLDDHLHSVRESA